MAKWINGLADRFEIPPEAVAKVPRLTLTGSSHVLIENHRGLLSYSDDEVEVGGGSIRIRVRGSGLSLKAMDADSLLISGRIIGVDTE